MDIVSARFPVLLQGKNKKSYFIPKKARRCIEFVQNHTENLSYQASQRVFGILDEIFEKRKLNTCFALATRLGAGKIFVAPGSGATGERVFKRKGFQNVCFLLAVPWKWSDSNGSKYCAFRAGYELW